MAKLYTELQELVQNINGNKEIDPTLPLFKLHLKHQIEAERAYLESTQDTA